MPRTLSPMADVSQYGSNNDSGAVLNSEMEQRFEEDSLETPVLKHYQDVI